MKEVLNIVLKKVEGRIVRIAKDLESILQNASNFYYLWALENSLEILKKKY